MAWIDTYDTFKSEVDGQVLQLLPKLNSEGYKQIGGAGVALERREKMLHIHEAKKVYGFTNTDWTKGTIVHHKDGDKTNNKLDNLCTFPDLGSHRSYHLMLGSRAFDFLRTHNLLDTFFKEFPELQVRTLKDMLVDSLKEL